MLLLIPGPVTTRPEVRAAMALDYAPWDNDFRALFEEVRARALVAANGQADTHVALPLQGCGHFAMEAAVRAYVPQGERLLVPMTGEYANRMSRLAEAAGRQVVRMPIAEGTKLTPAALTEALAAEPDITHVSLVYSETSSGIVHDVPELSAAAGAMGRRVLVDAVSAFGAMPLDVSAMPELDAVVFTANKCLEGTPGLAFAVARLDRLVAGRAGSWALDLADIVATGQRVGWGSSRFTPPAQVIAALRVALDLYDQEGGQPARLARYSDNMRALYEGVQALGLTPCLPTAVQGPIVVNVHAPADPAWNLQGFVDAVKRRGFVISNFYNTRTPSFRVGCIGAITPDDMRRAVAAMGEALDELGVKTRAAA